jgi:hypothetical protein
MAATYWLLSNRFFQSSNQNYINIKKATGIDQISPKILKIAKHAVVAPITQLINLSINTCTFPDKLKIAQVVPIHKKNSTLLKGNYRPVIAEIVENI